MCSTESIYTLGPHYILISFSALCLLYSQVEEMERIGNQAHNLKRNSKSQERITKEIRTLHGCGLQYQEDGDDGFTLVVSLFSLKTQEENTLLCEVLGSIAKISSLSIAQD